MAKSPFEKVRSLAERRKLFEQVLSEKGQIICKADEDSLFHFLPQSIVSETLLQGEIKAMNHLPREADAEIFGNFSVGSDKFFFHGPMKIMAEEAILPMACSVYRLERRSSLRIRLSSQLGIYAAVVELDRKPVYAIAQFADLSAGGARMFFSDLDSPLGATTRSAALPCRVGDRLKLVLHQKGKAKSLDLVAEVKHTQPAVHLGQMVDHIGIEFMELTQSARNRLLILTIDLQKQLALEP
jgi:hypothetical protein